MMALIESITSKALRLKQVSICTEGIFVDALLMIER